MSYLEKTFGIDLDRFFYVEHDKDGAAEGALNIIETVISSNSVDMVVVNSLKCLVPKEEFKKDLEDAVVALQARMNARMTRKFTSIVSENEVAFVLITHLTTQIGTMSRDPLIVSGGHAIAFASSLTVDMRKNSISKEDPIDKEEGIKVCLRVKKNHCTPRRNPYVQTTYYAIYDQGIERYLPLIARLTDEGILIKNGAFIKDPDENGEPKVIDDVKYQWQGSKALREFLVNNPAYYDELISRMQGSLIEDLSQEEIDSIKEEQKQIASQALKSKAKANKADKAASKTTKEQAEADAKALIRAK